jgi:hypothetical protein
VFDSALGRRREEQPAVDVGNKLEPSTRRVMSHVTKVLTIARNAAESQALLTDA